MGFAIAKAIAVALSMLFFAMYIEAHRNLISSMPPSPAPRITPKPKPKPYPYTRPPPPISAAPSPSPLTITPKPKPYPYTRPPPPISAPSPPPPFIFPRSYVVVKGFVYCRSCKHLQNKTLLASSTPLRGAIVKLQCNNTRITQQVKVKTAANGSFYIKAPKTVTSSGAHKCKVFLVSPPSKSKCTKRSGLNGGVKGASLRPFAIFFTTNNVSTVHYNVGPFAFETPRC